jgi:hypothetical protein
VNVGIGGAPSVSSGVVGSSGDCTVWLQTAGFGPGSTKSTLWTLELSASLSRDLNVTVPPTAISTELSPDVPASSWKKLSPVWNPAESGGSDLPASPP